MGSRKKRRSAWQSVILASMLTAGTLYHAPTAQSAPNVDEILAECQSRLVPIMEEERHPQTMHRIEIELGGQISVICDSARKRIVALGPDAIPKLISFIENANLAKPEAQYCAIVCSGALASFGLEGIKPAIAALKTHPDRQQYLTNTLLINFEQSFNYLNGLLQTPQDQAFHINILSDLLKNAHSQFWSGGLSSAVKEVRQKLGDKVSVDPLVFTANSNFRSVTGDTRTIPSDNLRLTAKITPVLIQSLNQSKSDEERIALIKALGLIYPGDVRVLPELEKILLAPGKFDLHPAAAESLGRAIFRIGTNEGKKRSKEPLLSNAELDKAEAALKAVRNGHFSETPAWYALIEIGAAFPERRKIIEECIKAPTRYPTRSFVVALMKTNGSPPPSLVLPALQQLADDQLAVNGSPLDKLYWKYAHDEAVRLVKELRPQYEKEFSQISAATIKGKSDQNTKEASVMQSQIAAVSAYESLLERARNLKKEAAPLVPKLIAAYEAAYPGDHAEARDLQMCLETIGPGAAPAVPWLVKKMYSQYGATSWGAIETLGAIGPAAKSCESDLRKFVLTNPRAVTIANENLAKMGLREISVKDLEATAWKKERALDYLESAPSGDYVQQTLSYLHGLGPNAAFAVPALIKYAKQTKVNDEYWSTRMRVAAVFESIGPAASPALPLLESWIQDKNVNIAAADAIRSIKGSR